MRVILYEERDNISLAAARIWVSRFALYRLMTRVGIVKTKAQAG